MVHTRPTNALKRPAQVVLDTKQKRWTAAQVKEDRARAEKEQEEQDQKAKQAIVQVAAAQQKAAIQQENTIESTPFKAPLHLESASSVSRPTGSALSQVTHATTNATTTATAPPATPESSVFNDDVEIEDHTPDSAEGPERLAVYTLTKMSKPKCIQKLMDVIKVKDVSKPPTPPIPLQMRLLQHGLGSTHPHITQSEPKDATVDPEGQEDSIMIADDADNFDLEDYDASAAMRNTVVDNTPPPKHIKREAEGDVMAGEALGAKYKNSDLPPGCLDRNLWCGVFIPTVAHAAGGENVHPWLIEDNVLIPILTKAWNIIYADNPSLMKYQIVPGGAIHHVVKQCLSEWHRGFGSAAVMIITSLMASDTMYKTDQEHTKFAKFWLEDNHFLFSDVSSDDPEVRMVRDVAVYIYVADFCCTSQGWMEIPVLNSEEEIMRASLALSAGVVKCALYLLSVGSMSFTITAATGKGKKKAANTTRKGKASASNGDIWEAVIGENESFSEPLWGYDTHMFMQAIKNVPSTAMEGIIQQAQEYMKATPRGGRSKGADEPVEEEIDEEYVNFLAFC
ncbi:hypothetical protein DFJ58DRAFT_722473 [Suillus subalutaceus]|uniref:uncharacterized protein n=1 Tax=Suillus subalutaceus TaxID=48586 RepID=UPI001B8656BA|nr:uncharacterized protein DFJ58DRAFT_722473 [Suillus subalutaceus]KAG1871739.1 hypothetical protein DFJ58DRAFT_722473 [Suillus subalutaceus]